MGGFSTPTPECSQRVSAVSVASGRGFEPGRELLELPARVPGRPGRARLLPPDREDHALEVGVLEADRVRIVEVPAGHQELHARDVRLDLALVPVALAPTVAVAQDEVGQLVAEDSLSDEIVGDHRPVDHAAPGAAE